MLCGSSGLLFLPAGHSGCFWVWPPCATKVNATVVKRDTPRDAWNVFVRGFTHTRVQYSYAVQPKGWHSRAGNGNFGCATERGGLVATALFVCYNKTAYVFIGRFLTSSRDKYTAVVWSLSLMQGLCATSLLFSSMTDGRICFLSRDVCSKPNCSQTEPNAVQSNTKVHECCRASTWWKYHEFQRGGSTCSPHQHDLIIQKQGHSTPCDHFSKKKRWLILTLKGRCFICCSPQNHLCDGSIETLQLCKLSSNASHTGINKAL